MRLMGEINKKRDDLDKWTYISALGEKVEELDKRIKELAQLFDKHLDNLNVIADKLEELKKTMMLEFERKT